MKYLHLAAGYIFIAGVLALMVKVLIVGLEPDIAFSERDISTQVITVWGFIGGLFLWIWMLSDFFRNGVPTLKRTWGFLLVAGSYVVAIIYFIVIYAPRRSKRLNVH